MNVTASTQSLTKQLRSKGITTGEICDIYAELDFQKYYFPNKEIFALELINDRWNDQKLVNFKTDYRIWALYNQMWLRLRDDEMILKKLFKQVKFVPHLIKTLEIVDVNLTEFATELRKTCEMINSIITVNVSIESANSIMGKTLRLVSKLADGKSESQLTRELIEQMKNLTGIENISEVNTKSANVYCNVLLLPTTQYISECGGERRDDMVVSFLTEQLGVFLFDSSVDTLKQLENFFKVNRDQLRSKDTLVLYQILIKFLSKQNFHELEKIFTMIVDIQPELTRDLLQALSLSKKTMSNEFLTKILEKTLEGASRNNMHDANFWNLISQLLNLDIELGIKSSDLFLDLIYEHRLDSPEDVKLIWKKIANCHINAREFPKYVEKLESYCQKSGIEKSSFFLKNPFFAEVVSQNISSFSSLQLQDSISIHLERIKNNSKDDITFLVFRAIICGLQTLSYTVLANLKSPLSIVFEPEFNMQSKIWELRYLVMNIFDDIIPPYLLDSWDGERETSILKSKTSKEVFFYFFKLREYKVFDMTEVIAQFMKYLGRIDEEEKLEVIQILFTNWSTLINTNVTRTDLSVLIDFILAQKNTKLLDNLLEEDDIFEENNIIGLLSSKLAKLHTSDMYLASISKIPLQCINKSVRVELINSICCNKAPTSELEVHVLDYLLSNPTFKSDIESNFSVLSEFVAKNLKCLKYEDKVFQKVWNNHITQIKEDKSKQFLEDGIADLSQGILNKNFDKKCFQMSFLAITADDASITESLGTKFIESTTCKILNSDVKDLQTLSWLLRSLYFIFGFSHNLNPTNSQATGLLSQIVKFYNQDGCRLDKDFLVSLFVLYSTLYNDKLEFLFAQYLLLREAGAQSSLLSQALELVIERYLKKDTQGFNQALASTVSSFSNCTEGFYAGLLDLYQFQTKSINKDNKIGIHLFAASISEFYTNSDKYQYSREGVVGVLDTMQFLLINKPWLFSQHATEMLFPMSLKISLIFLESSNSCDDVFLATVKVISNVVFAHRLKMSNRHHLVNALICEFLEMLSTYQEKQLTAVSAKALSRLITCICVPNLGGNQTFKTNDLNSRVGIIKKNLRKYIPVILIKYIHLSSVSPFKTSIRKELTPAIFSIFDLLSHNELVLLNAALDYSGVQYFRSLYSDYKKTGKWSAD